jgi:hypothetical protein
MVAVVWTGKLRDNKYIHPLSNTIKTVFTLPILAFPSAPNPDVNSFNWSVVFYVALFMITIPWYFLRARKWFTGPALQSHLADSSSFVDTKRQQEI